MLSRILESYSSKIWKEGNQFEQVREINKVDNNFK